MKVQYSAQLISYLMSKKITALCKRLDELWEKNRGNVVIFTWIQFLKEDTLEFLNIQSPLEIQTIDGQPQCESVQNEAVDTAVEKSKLQDLDQRAVQEVYHHADIPSCWILMKLKSRRSLIASFFAVESASLRIWVPIFCPSKSVSMSTARPA